MEYSIKIAKIINNYMNINNEKLLELVKVPPNEEMGDYTFPCYELKKSIKKSPAVIAEEMSKNIKDDIFEKIDSCGPYVNFYLNKEKLAENIINEILEKEESFGNLSIGVNKKICIEYPSLDEDKNFDLSLLYSIILANYLNQIYIKAGYDTESRVYISNYKGNVTEKFRVIDLLGIKFDEILQKCAYKSDIEKRYNELINKNLIYKENATKIINLKSYNLPPLICTKSNEKFIRSMQFIDYYIKQDNDKIIFVSEIKKSLEIKKVFSVLNLLGYDCNKDCIEVNNSNVKFIQNSFKFKIQDSIDVNYIFTEAEYRVQEKFRNSKCKLNIDFMKLGINSVIFEFLRHPIEQDMHLDLDKVFSEKENSSYKILENLILVKNAVMCFEIDNGLNVENNKINKKSINKLKEFSSVIEESLERIQPCVIAEYIVKLNSEIRVNDINYENFNIIIAITQVIENSLKILGIFI